MPVIEIISPVEESCSQNAPNTTGAVHGAGIYWVVNLQLLEEHGCSLVNNRPNQADGKGRSSFNVATACSDGDQTREDAIAQARNVVLVDNEIAQDEDCDSTCGGGQCGVHSHLRCQCAGVLIVQSQSRAGVEAIPAEPKCKGTQHNHWQVVAIESLWNLKAVLARSQHNGARQASHSTCEVHNSAACKVHDTGVEHGISPTSTPSGGDHQRIDQARHHECEKAKGWCLHTLCHSSTHNGCCCCAKCPLKEPA
mmetsp:Transcript_952/g.1015  ORF Transcript_952/g.1015 Transcript_952/m.1015 type:complete len:253 (-) Transcript_952:245-1003(-)